MEILSFMQVYTTVDRNPGTFPRRGTTSFVIGVGPLALSTALLRPAGVALLLSRRTLRIALAAVDGPARRERKERQLLDVLSTHLALQVERSYIMHSDTIPVL
jgi:hypothetical protein